MRSLNIFDYLALILIIIGGLNWGLVGLFDFNLVTAIFGPLSLISKTIYILVGISAAYAIYLTFQLMNSEPKK